MSETQNDLGTPPTGPSFEDRIAGLTFRQQVVVRLLASGMGPVWIARNTGISRKTIQRFKARAEIGAIVQEWRLTISAPAVETMLEEFYVAARANAAKGILADHRWFLDRTLFLENRMALARAAKGMAPSVSVTVAAQRGQVERQDQGHPPSE